MTKWNAEHPEYLVKESNFENDFRKFLVPVENQELLENIVSDQNAILFLNSIKDEVIKEKFKDYIIKSSKHRNIIRENLIHYTYIWYLNSLSVYCGISYYPPMRWDSAKRKAINNTDNLLFYNAIHKYGFNNFERKVIFIYGTLTEAKDAEIQLIEENKTCIIKYPNNGGYNLTPGGDMWDGKLSSSAFKKGRPAHNKKDISLIQDKLIDLFRGGVSITNLCKVVEQLLLFKITTTSLCIKIKKLIPNEYGNIIKVNIGKNAKTNEHWTKRKTKEEVKEIYNIISRANVINYTDEEEKKMVELRLKFTSLKEIAAIYDVSRQVIQRILKKHNIKDKHITKKLRKTYKNISRYTNEEENKIIELRFKPTSLQEIATIYNVSRTVIKKILKKHNINDNGFANKLRKASSKNMVRFTSEEEENIIKLRFAPTSIKDIAVIYEVGYGIIVKVLKKHNIKNDEITKQLLSIRHKMRQKSNY